MGQAFTGVADTVETLGINPAGLGSLSGSQVCFTHDSYIQGEDIEQLAGSLPCGTGSLALGLDYFNFGNVERILINNNTPSSGGTFQPSAWLVNLGYGLGVAEEWNLGLSAKIFQDSLDASQAMGFAGDLGALWNPKGTNLKVGLSILNLGALASFSIPDEARLGASYSFLLSAPDVKTLKDTLLVAADAVSPFSAFSATQVDLGAEFWYHDLVALRAGQEFTDTTGLSGWGGFTTGIGLRLNQIQLDYAFATKGDLGNTNLVSLMGRF
jgi:long-subunit fatty acid transport protein